jgi:hypothetical protein
MGITSLWAMLNAEGLAPKLEASLSLNGAQAITRVDMWTVSRRLKSRLVMVCRALKGSTQLSCAMHPAKSSLSTSASG